MYNSIILEGSLLEDPQSLYEPSGAHTVMLSIHVPLPAKAPPTYWALVYDMRAGQEFDRGSETFLVLCRETLAQTCLATWKAGDRVRIVGRMVITTLVSPTPYGKEILPLAEVQAHEISSIEEGQTKD